jgi:pyruvate kinase
MNRKKKINSILKKRLKKANSKLSKTNKPKYISKGDRVLLDDGETKLITEEQSDES